MNTLPPGYLDIGAAAIHMRDLRQHSKDVHRFMANLSDALALLEVEPGSPQAFQIVGNRSETELHPLVMTCEELAALNFALANELRQA